MTCLLECRSVVAGYGSLAVVRGIDLQVHAGSVVAILGPNGAGKTTLLETLAGFLPVLGGQILVDGQELPGGSPRSAAKAGVILVPDDRALFTSLTVEENIEVARSKGSPPAASVLEWFPALEWRWRVLAGSLSGGEQQMLAVARGLIQEPRILLVDEMSMGLAPIVVEEMLPVIRNIATSSGTAVVLVEQHVHLALEFADHAVVLVHGEIALRGGAAELEADPARLEAAYLGTAVSA